MRSAALIAILGVTARRGRQHDDQRAGQHADLDRCELPEEQFRTDAGVLDGVGCSATARSSDMLWARPAVTVLGIDARR